MIVPGPIPVNRRCAVTYFEKPPYTYMLLLEILSAGAARDHSPPRPPLRRATASQEPALYRHRDPDAGPGHRDEHRRVLRDRDDAPASLARRSGRSAYRADLSELARPPLWLDVAGTLLRLAR